MDCVEDYRDQKVENHAVPLLMHHGSDVLGLSGQFKADRLETGIGDL